MKSHYTVLDTYDGVPLPDALLRQLHWKEGDRLLVEVVGDAMILTRDETKPVMITRKDTHAPSRD